MLIILSLDNNPLSVKKLLDNNANINLKDQHGTTALNIASEYGNYNIVQLLLK